LQNVVLSAQSYRENDKQPKKEDKNSPELTKSKFIPLFMYFLLGLLWK